MSGGLAVDNPPVYPLGKTPHTLSTGDVHKFVDIVLLRQCVSGKKRKTGGVTGTSLQRTCTTNLRSLLPHTLWIASDYEESSFRSCPMVERSETSRSMSSEIFWQA